MNRCQRFAYFGQVVNMGNGVRFRETERNRVGGVVSLRRLYVGLLILSALTLGSSRALAQANDELKVDVKINAFGTGGIARAGEWVGLNVGLRSREAKPRPVLVVWEMVDPDGDVAEVSDQTVLNPGGNDSVWLYGKLSYRATLNSEWTINVYALNKDHDRLNEVLGTLRFRAQTVLDADISMIGVIGLKHAGLSRYAVNVSNNAYAAAANERTQITTGIPVAGLPTRWMGLSQFESLVWVDGDPLALSLETAEALREWVYRGGHLVLVLPDLAQKWQTTLLNPILPEVGLITLEDQEIRDERSSGGVLRYLMRPTDASGSNSSEGGFRYQLPPQHREPRYPILTLHLFRALSENGWGATATYPLMPVDRSFARRIIDKESGGDDSSDNSKASLENETLTFAAQRQVGFGAVTLVGIPVTDQLLNRPGIELPEAEVFWNRILARRCDTPSLSELNQINSMTRSKQNGLNVGRDLRRTGGSLPGSIELKSEGGAGFLLALVLFIIYWVTSGPLAFGILKNKGWERQSWLAFALIGVVFAFIGWGGAKLLRSRGILPRHLTVVDHIYGEEWQHSRSFITAPLEGYGTQPVAATLQDPEEKSKFHDTVVAFTDPDSVSSTFPDPRRYEVDSADQHVVAYPARSTARQFVVDSMHRPIQGWGMPNFDDELTKPRIVSPPPGAIEPPTLSGVLKHSLPAPLRNVKIIFVSNQEWQRFGKRPVETAWSYPRLKAYSWEIDPWRPGDELDLHADLKSSTVPYFWNGTGATTARSDVLTIMEHYGRSTFGGFGGDSASVYTPANLQMDIEALSFYRLLDQPKWVGEVKGSPLMLDRRMGRELDLSAWLNRPCLIILGYLEQGEEPLPLPAPMTIGGASVDQTATNSHVFIRWIFPFPANK